MLSPYNDRRQIGFEPETTGMLVHYVPLCYRHFQTSYIYRRIYYIPLIVLWWVFEASSVDVYTMLSVLQ